MTYDHFERQVRLSCRATVGGEQLEISATVVEAVYEDPVTREFIEKQLRMALMNKILEKWTPKIHVQR